MPSIENLTPGERAVLDALRHAATPKTSTEIYVLMDYQYSQPYINACLRWLLGFRFVKRYKGVSGKGKYRYEAINETE